MSGYRSVRVSFWAVGIFLLLALGVGTSPVAAHALLERSDPAADAVLATSPAQITLWFTERLEARESSAGLDDQHGRPIPGVASHPGPDPTMLIMTLPAHLPSGTYSVVWQTLSADDGHEASGYFAFTVGTQANVAIVVPPAVIGPTGPPAWQQTTSRWLAYLGLALCVAIWPVWLLVLRPGIGPAWQSGPSLTRRVRKLAVAAIGFAFIANIIALLVQAEVGSGGELHRLWITLRDTRYGRLWFVRQGLLLAEASVLLLAAWWWPWRRKVASGLALVIALALPLPFSLAAHAEAQPTGRATAVAFDMAHLLGASLWVGGILYLVGGLMPALHQLSPARRRAVLVRAIPRFSLLALTAWGVMGVTGLYAAWLQVGNLAGLLHTAYGHTLGLKILLVIPLLCLGAFNLLVVTKRIRAAKTTSGAARWSRHFTQAVAAEAVLAVVLLLVVGRLTHQVPAREDLASRSGQAILTFQSGGRTATLSVAPATPGFNHDRLTVSGTTLPAQAMAILRVTPPNPQLGQRDISLVRAAGNAFEAHTSDFSLTGRWTVEAIVRVPNQNDWTATQALMIGTTPPAADVPGTPWRFTTAGIVGLLLLVLGIAGGVVAILFARGSLRKESGGLGFAALTVGIVFLSQARVGSTTVAANPQQAGNPVPISAVSMASGQAVFDANCVACHGAHGQGNGPAAAGLFPPPADLTSAHSRSHLDEDFYYWIQNGIQGSAMPDFNGKLSAEQTWDVIDYIRGVFQKGSAGGSSATPPPRISESSVVSIGTPTTVGAMTVTLLPTQIHRGATTVAIVVMAGATPVNGAAVVVAPQAPHAGAQVTPILAAAAGSGRYTTTIKLDQPGSWQLDVQVAGPTIGVGLFRFALNVE